MKTKYVCTECGEQLKVSSTTPVMDNNSNMTSVVVWITPCKCQKENTND